MINKSITAITLKKLNKGKVYQYIYQQRHTSKQQIVQDLHMGLSTVSQNLNDLEKEGLIERNGFFDSTGGRKAQIIRIIPDRKISIGVGILKDIFHIVAVDLYGSVTASETIALPYRGTPSYYTNVAKQTERFIHKNQYTEEQIAGISIATQGIISPDGSSVTYGKILNNSDMKLSDFSSILPFPCHLEHDSKTAAQLELWNHPEIDSAVVFLLNQNLGGAIITDRKIHQGLSMHSGTIEHICIDPAGPVCYCGNNGCLETYCSANALEHSAGMPVKEFFARLRTRTDSKLTQIWEEYLNHLAFAMRNMNMVIDGPLIISGYLAPHFTEEDIEKLLKLINSSTPFSMPKENIIIGTHGQYTSAVGAALYYTKEFIDTIINGGSPQ